VTGALWMSGPAQAGFQLENVSTSSTAADGSFSRQAGAHPDLDTHFEVSYDHTTSLLSGNPKNVSVELPPGFVGSPTAVPQCQADLLVPVSATDAAKCPPQTQIGIATVASAPGVRDSVPLFNMQHPSDVPAIFGFNYLTVPVYIQPRVRPGDYGITGLSAQISQAKLIYGADITIWGVPASHAHDFERRDPTGEIAGSFECVVFGGAACAVPGAQTVKPFLSNQTSCPAAPVTTTISGDSWQEPDLFSTSVLSSDADGTPFVIEGCESLGFAPKVSAAPTSHKAAAPTGLEVGIEVPQNETPDGLATAHVRKTVLTLPQGITISASSAAGLGSCSPAQIGIGTNDPPTCPDSSKIGTVEIGTPLLESPLQGDIVLARQNDNPFNSLLALYIAVKGPGFYLKLPGKVEADPTTGQLTTTFSNTPQLPFETLKVNLDSGSQAALQAPEACGTYSTHIEMTSWASDLPVSFDTPMTFGEGCNTGGFSPGLRASVSSPVGGKFSPFNLQVTRNDGEQNLSRIEATLPPGELAKLAGVPLCPDSAAATGACPAASQVGTTTVGAGAGPSPVYVPEPGKAPTAVYLAGPYKGAPYSIVVKVPAQAGPFDLGTVTVRNALSIDPTTAQVTAKSDPLPQILQGIPVSYRDVRVEINRPDFSLNPTSCDPMKVTSILTSSGGKTASPSSRFQVAGCGELGFAPKLNIAVKGPTRRGAYQQLKAVLTQPKGQANIGKVSVALPHSEFLAQNHIRTVCTRVQFNAGAGNGAGCPAGSVYGKARAISPLLDRPLEGLVYLRSSSNPLPDLVAALHGQIDVDLSGRIDSVNGGIRTTFNSVPDAPVSKFFLEMKGGKKSLLVNSTNLCAAPNKATVKMDGQNGKTNDFNPVVTNSCKGKKKQGKPAKSSRTHR
jgi:hypothetical protein